MNGKKARQRRREGGKRPDMRQPVRLIQLDQYVSDRWGVSLSAARRWRMTGKVNINGKVVYADTFPKHLIERNERGSRRVMVEGQRTPEQVW